jgi:hypothetical protein
MANESAHRVATFDLAHVNATQVPEILVASQSFLKAIHVQLFAIIGDEPLHPVTNGFGCPSFTTFEKFTNLVREKWARNLNSGAMHCSTCCFKRG